MGLPEWRRELYQNLKDLVLVLESLDTHHAQLRASLYQQRIRCGHPNCHCAQGPGHLRWCLSFESSRGRHTRSLSDVEVREWAPGAEAYRRYRQLRAQAARLFRRILGLVDRIQKALAHAPRPPRRR